MLTQKLQVIAVEKQVNETLLITFKPIGFDQLNYQAGQFLTLILELYGKQLRRSYSLYSSPEVSEPPSVAVKLVENGEISRFIHQQIAKGDVITVTEPNGLFVYQPIKESKRTVFLFAAGVGITPLFSILKTALQAETNTKIVLVYSNRRKEDTLFWDDLAQWQSNYPHRLKVIYLFSNSKNLMRARLNGTLIHQLVKEEIEFEAKEALFYTCGPVDYMDVCKFTLLGMGFAPTQIKRETFVLPEDEQDEDDTSEKIIDTQTYTVILDVYGKKHQLAVPYQQSILTAALAHQIQLPYSCSSGVCSTCVATCVKGGVKMDYNEVLTDQEVENGRVLVCTAHPTENDTTLVWD